MKNKISFLIAPLNWGLGHAGRCIPIIHALLDKGAEVQIASDGRALELLCKEFPQLKYREIPSYNIRYFSRHMWLNLMWQGPRIIAAIDQENLFLKKIIDKEKIDVLISDNRLGFYNNKVQSVYITHQWNIHTLNPLASWGINAIHRKFIKKFDIVWIPDVPDFPGLAGQLSHDNLVGNIRYIGSLSRLQLSLEAVKYKAAVVLSGPEPQRTMLEKRVLSDLQQLSGNFVVVGGRTESDNRDIRREKNIKYFPFLLYKDLNRIMLESEVIICRSGYSSIMDLYALKKKALLIPTPGQREQEYLANIHESLGPFVVQQQSKLNISEGLRALEAMEPKFKVELPEGLLDQAIDPFFTR